MDQGGDPDCQSWNNENKVLGWKSGHKVSLTTLHYKKMDLIIKMHAKKGL